MATANQTARDKFIQLRTSWVDPVTARQQAYWNVTPAQTWGAVQAQSPTPTPAQTTPAQTPTPTPAPTPVVPPAMTGKDIVAQNQANRQQMIAEGKVPAVWQQNVTPTPPPVTTPETPAPAQTPTTTAPVDKTVEIKAQTDAQMAINKQQADLKEQERQKLAQETAQANTPKTASDMYNIIASKQDVPLALKNTGAYRVANNRYQRVNQYVNMTPTEVNQAFTNGKLIEGSQTFEDLKSLNPKLAQDAINLRKVNGNKTNIFTYTNNPDGTPVKTNNLEKQFAEQYEEDHPDIIELIKSTFNTPSYAEMQAQINTPEVKALQDKATAIESEMNGLQTDMESVDKDVEKELAGTGASSSRIALEKASRRDVLQKQYDAKLRDYTTQYNKATNLINQNTEMYKYAQEQNKAMQTALSNVYTRQYEANLWLQTKQAEMQMETDFAKKQAELAQNDPYTAISGIMAQYQEMGIPFSQSIQTKVADANKFIAQGGTLSGYLDKMIKDIQAKPEYKAKFVQKTEAPTTKEIDVNWQKVTVQWNGKEWTPVQWATIERELAKQKYGSTPAVRNFNPWNIMDTWFWGRKVEWERFTVFDTPAEWFNALVAKIQNIQNGLSKVYSPDMTLLQYISKYAPSSDGNNPKSYATAIANNLGISIDTKIGQIDPVKLAEEHARHEDWNSYKMLKDLWIIGSTGATGTKPLTDKQFTQSNQIITSFKADPQVKAFEEAYSQWMSLISSLNDKTWPWDVAAVFQFMKTLDPQSVVRETEFELAAKSAWVTEYIGNTFDRIMNGKKLTDTQAEAFWKLAKQFIIDKSKLYDTKYRDWVRRLEKQGIDTSVFPESTAEQMRQMLWMNNQKNLVEITKEKAIDLYNEWKSNQN
jgi:hypothetical protein